MTDDDEFKARKLRISGNVLMQALLMTGDAPQAVKNGIHEGCGTSAMFDTKAEMQASADRHLADARAAEGRGAVDQMHFHAAAAAIQSLIAENVWPEEATSE